MEIEPTMFVTKEEMAARFGFPYFGYTVTRTSLHHRVTGIWVRSDIPASVQISVRAHERQHWQDNAFQDGRVWYWEARAWVAGFKADWRGFLQAIWLSVTDWERVKLYLLRIKNNF